MSVYSLRNGPKTNCLCESSVIKTSSFFIGRVHVGKCAIVKPNQEKYLWFPTFIIGSLLERRELMTVSGRNSELIKKTCALDLVETCKYPRERLRVLASKSRIRVDRNWLIEMRYGL